MYLLIKIGKYPPPENNLKHIYKLSHMAAKPVHGLIKSILL